VFVKKLSNCESFLAGDSTILKELFNPSKDKLCVNYSLAHAIVKPNSRSIKHSLTTSEVYYILKGSGIMHIEIESQNVSEGDTIIIPPNSVQFIENSGSDDLIFLCIVEPAWQAENEIVLE